MEEDFRHKSPDAGRLGKAAEHLVAASCIIQSRARLNVSTALVDDEGVDLVFHRRDGSATLAVQVKARMSDSKGVQRGIFRVDVRTQTFRPRRDLFLLGVVVNMDSGSIGMAWLVPSIVVAETIRPNAMARLPFTASLGEASQDRWRQYRHTASELPGRILNELEALERAGV